jgi:prophage DNA circulation protein
MSAFDNLAKASFDGIAFPVSSYEVVGGLRDHVHEYPHSPGGAPEKLGRKLYTIRMSAFFDVRVAGYGDNLWPGDLSDLRDRFEDQVTSTLLIPTIGEIQAYAVTWTQRTSSERRSGEDLEVEFREDQASAFLFEGLINVTASTLKSASAEFDEDFEPLLAGGTLTNTGIVLPTGTMPLRATTVAAAYSQFRQTDVDRIAKIRSDFTQAIAYAEAPDLYAERLLAKTEALIAACALAYERIVLLKNPLAWKPLRSFKRTWASAQRLRESVAGRTNRILFYRAEIDTSLSAVSRAIYGDTSWGGTLLRLNAIPDPFRIPKGTLLRYYDPKTLGNEAA